MSFWCLLRALILIDGSISLRFSPHLSSPFHSLNSTHHNQLRHPGLRAQETPRLCVSYLLKRERENKEREKQERSFRLERSQPQPQPRPLQKNFLSLLSSAFSEEFRDARGFGWSSSPPPFDWRALIDRKGREVERLNAVYNRLLTSAGVNLFEGRATLEAPHRVRVEMMDSKEDGGDGEDPTKVKKAVVKILTARHVLVATGGSAVKAPVPGAEEFAITSDDALVLEDLPLPIPPPPPPRGGAAAAAAPNSALMVRGPVVLVGAGYIALEFAGIFAGLGCDVRVLYRRDLPLAGFDGECRAHVAECMSGRGIAMMAGTSPTR